MSWSISLAFLTASSQGLEITSVRLIKPTTPQPKNCRHFVLLSTSSRRNERVQTSRRNYLCEACASLAAVGTAVTPTEASFAAAPSSPAEAIRRSASGLPGYGPTDVFYPDSWVGLWRIQRQVSFGSEINEKPLVFEYNIRFLPAIEAGKVVADRGFNQSNLEAAVAKSREPSPMFQWEPDNPNDLRLSWPDGSRKDIKVAQRAVDYQHLVEGKLWSSEVQRVTIDSTDSRIPSISLRRVVTRWSWEASPDRAPPSLVKAIEILYDLGGSDPMLSNGEPINSNRPILSKSLLIMKKL